jgi:phosphoglucosamine mutase
MRKLFGTDGIRGIAGEYPLDERTTFAIGRALGHYLLRTCAAPRVIIGQDTRESSDWIAVSLACGLRAHQVETVSAGVLTTPGIAYLARAQNFAAGVVISASHNPWRDNGIKIFGSDGYKLPDDIELEIENEIFAHLGKPASDLKAPPSATSLLPGDANLTQAYVNWLANTVADEDLSRLKVLVDCGNGAATPIAHEVFRRCGVDATFIHDVPDGRNINDHCGALFPQVIAEAVRRGNSESRQPRYLLGVTFDGDADRALFSDELGNIINGDAVLLLSARSMKQQGTLFHNTVVATTMSNMGLEAALRRSGIKMLRAAVGDKYVLEEMQRTGATLGGEQSGHIIFRDGDATTGDGLLTALRVMSKMARAGQSLRELTSDLKVYPQIIKNVRVRHKTPLEQLPEVAAAIKQAESELNDSGRIVVRYSGTESLLRVMVEAESEQQMHRLADLIAYTAQRTLGM